MAEDTFGTKKVSDDYTQFSLLVQEQLAPMHNSQRHNKPSVFVKPTLMLEVISQQDTMVKQQSSPMADLVSNRNTMLEVESTEEGDNLIKSMGSTPANLLPPPRIVHKNDNA